MYLQRDANSEDGNIMFFRNVGVNLPEDTMSSPEDQNLHCHRVIVSDVTQIQ
jgi:hypothetical protein